MLVYGKDVTLNLDFPSQTNQGLTSAQAEEKFRTVKKSSIIQGCPCLSSHYKTCINYFTCE